MLAEEPMQSDEMRGTLAGKCEHWPRCWHAVLRLARPACSRGRRCQGCERRAGPPYDGRRSQADATNGLAAAQASECDRRRLLPAASEGRPAQDQIQVSRRSRPASFALPLLYSLLSPTLQYVGSTRTRQVVEGIPLTRRALSGQPHGLRKYSAFLKRTGFGACVRAPLTNSVPQSLP